MGQITNIIESALRQEYNSGKKQRELATLHNVTQQYIQLLLSGQSTPGGIAIETLEKMFPHATINLHGDSSTVRTNDNCGNVIKGNRRGKAVNMTDCEACIGRIRDAVMLSNISAEAKVAVYQIIAGAK